MQTGLLNPGRTEDERHQCDHNRKLPQHQITHSHQRVRMESSRWLAELAAVTGG